MKTFTTLAIFGFMLLLYNQTIAQGLIAVQNGNNVSFYTQVTAAVTAANRGDTIFIPGGSWSIGELNINKTLHIIGVGHNPDSTQVGVYTYLSGSIYLQQGCSHGSLSGLYISQSVRNNSATDTIVNFSIVRCRIGGSMFLDNFSMGLIAENIIEFQVANNYLAKDNSFISNIFTSNVGQFGPGNNFKNNLLLSSSYTAWTFSDCLFENNIIFSDRFVDPMTNCVFQNNLFVYNISFPIGTNLGSSNIVNQTRESIFVNQSGDSFDYTQDYQLKPDSPGKKAGRDGTDIGIYGGAYPWKEGSIPANPHFQSIKIGPKTDNSGNLNVKIKVAAQDH